MIASPHAPSPRHRSFRQMPGPTPARFRTSIAGKDTDRSIARLPATPDPSRDPTTLGVRKCSKTGLDKRGKGRGSTSCRDMHGAAPAPLHLSRPPPPRLHNMDSVTPWASPQGCHIPAACAAPDIHVLPIAEAPSGYPRAPSPSRPPSDAQRFPGARSRGQQRNGARPHLDGRGNVRPVPVREEVPAGFWADQPGVITPVSSGYDPTEATPTPGRSLA